MIKIWDGKKKAHDISHLFPIATAQEVREARRELGWPTWKKEVIAMVKRDEQANTFI